MLKGTEWVLLGLDPRGVTLINESDYYRLILRSNATYAEEFQEWVTGEVPSQPRCQSKSVTASYQSALLTAIHFYM
ncbi:MAG: hypothetical protein HF981_07330 [Desulfobacteraceae bacterium]|nr:hypothetical protein [Desulfobacteraceae bacterium]MBC2750180.1 hypothetical protein [Desulfobacteraceae bacterium]